MKKLLKVTIIFVVTFQHMLYMTASSWYFKSKCTAWALLLMIFLSDKSGKISELETIRIDFKTLPFLRHSNGPRTYLMGILTSVPKIIAFQISSMFTVLRKKLRVVVVGSIGAAMTSVLKMTFTSSSAIEVGYNT